MPRNFLPLKMAPGLVQAESPAAAPGRWYDGNLIRWESGNVRPVKGWTRFVSVIDGSKIRKCHSWVDNSGVHRMALLCENKLYIVEGSTLKDVTPAGGFLNAPNIPNAGGWGTGPFGTGPYGTLRTGSDTYKFVADAYTLDNWGETLIAMVSFDGRLIQWDPSIVPTAKATIVSGAPTNNRFFTVTDERHVVLWGIANSPNSFGWCSQENINDWNFASVTNSAGQYDIEPAAEIFTAIKCRSGVLFFTNNGSYLLSYQGAPYIYSYSPVSDTAIPVSAEAVCEFGGTAMWFSDNGFWQYDGSTASPVNCDLQDSIINNFDDVYARARAFMVNIQSKNEIWLFYPKMGSTENDTLIIWNFAENWWSKGKLNRTCGYRASYTSYPIMSDGTNLYLHERGGTYTDYTEVPYVTSGALTTKDGAVKGTLKQMIVDNPGDPLAVLYSFTGNNRANPSLVSNNVVAPKLAREDGYLDVRITARDVSMKLQSAANGNNSWSFGMPLLDFKSRGAR